MSDNMQTKPNQLVSAPAASTAKAIDGDDLFAGLGLGDYVAKKDTGAIATGLMAPKAPAMAGPVNGGSVGGVNPVCMFEGHNCALQSEHYALCIWEGN